jgi:O-antigen/teichoic acid export membrane protein
MFLKNLYQRVAGVLSRDVLVSIVSFIVTTYLANMLGVELFGLWIGVITLMTIFDLLFRLKLDQLIVFYSREYPFNNALYKKISMWSLFGVMVGGLLALSLNAIIVDYFSLDNPWFLFLIFCNFSLSVLGNITFYIFLAESKYSAYNFSILGQSLTAALCVYGLFYIFESSIFLALIAHLLSWGFVIIFFMVHRIIVSEEKSAVRKPCYLSSHELLVKGSYIYTASAVRVIADQLPRLFGISFLGAAFVGNFGLAQIILGLISRVPLAINTVLYPMLVREDGNELIRSIEVLKTLLLIFIPIILFLEISMAWFIITFYGKDFSATVLYVRILLPFVYLGLPGLILTSYFASQGRLKALFMINLMVLLCSMICLYCVSLISKEYAPIVALCGTFLGLTISSVVIASKTVPVLEFIPKTDDLLKMTRFIKTAISG